MEPRLQCPKCGQVACSVATKFFAVDYVARACQSCGARLMLGGNALTFLLTLFWFLPAMLVTGFWAKVAALTVMTLLNGSIRLYKLPWVVKPEEISFGA